MPQNLILPMRPAAMPILVAGPYQFHTAANSFCRWNCSQLITSRHLMAVQYAPSTLAGSTPSRSAASFAERSLQATDHQCKATEDIESGANHA